MLEDLQDDVACRVSESEAAEMRESRWERATVDLLSRLNRSDSELDDSPKGVVWKVAIARMLRERYLVPNVWIGRRLVMGQTSTVQSLVSRHRTANKQNDKIWETLQKHEKLGWWRYSSDPVTAPYGYYGITGNIRSLNRLRHEVQKHWRKWLGRRTRGGPMNWNRFNGLLVNYPLIPPKIVHSYKTPSESMI